MIIAPLFLRQSRQPPQEAAEKLIFKHRVQQYLQRFVLATKDIPFFRNLYSALYRIAAKLFVFFTLRAERELGIRVLEAIYLRRGVGRGELVLGASDLDFFVVLKTVSAQQEMHFLQLFWKNYSVLRNIFPFLGETLMGDRNELENWMQTGCVQIGRAHV